MSTTQVIGTVQNQSLNRSTVENCLGIFRSIEMGRTTAHELAKSENLRPEQLTEYLERLGAVKLLGSEVLGGIRYYHLTEKGNEVFSDLRLAIKSLGYILVARSK